MNRTLSDALIIDATGFMMSIFGRQKRDLKGGPLKAKKAYALYRKFQPDGVIAIDDNAQSMFVVPYLKDKVSVPVMFCGVNSDPDKYGYPASNVTGILERPHISESIAFVKQLVPSVNAFGFIGRDSITTKSMLRQIQHDAMKVLGIMPKPILLKGTELIETEHSGDR
ncbi:MAG: hypothetical protein PVJ84_13215 [Desulfobacteraceae bacterium]|jgi:ABC-type uncharacterized transport system substrate-binding protein